MQYGGLRSFADLNIEYHDLVLDSVLVVDAMSSISDSRCCGYKPMKY
jgi:hypothetical protein